MRLDLNNKVDLKKPFFLIIINLLLVCIYLFFIVVAIYDKTIGGFFNALDVDVFVFSVIMMFYHISYIIFPSIIIIKKDKVYIINMPLSLKKICLGDIIEIKIESESLDLINILYRKCYSMNKLFSISTEKEKIYLNYKSKNEYDIFWGLWRTRGETRQSGDGS